MTASTETDLAALRHRYAAAHRGPGGGEEAVPEALVIAHRRLGQRRVAGTSAIASYPADGPFGAALQIVTDAVPMLVESVTVMLARLGLPYVSTSDPTFLARRDADGELLDLDTALPGDGDPRAGGFDGSDEGRLAETWLHVTLAASADPACVDEVVTELPGVLADVAQVGADTAAMRAEMAALADALDADADADGTRFAGDREDVAALLRWLGDGHFALTGHQRCRIVDAAAGGAGRAEVDDATRHGVLRRRADVFPPLAAPGELLVLAQAVIPSFLRYGTYPHVVVVREQGDGPQAVEHRFVGLFTVAAAHSDVLGIPVVARRVRHALRLSGLDPAALSGQLLLDVLQTFPRSELLTQPAERLAEMATTVSEPGAARRTSLFLRSDQLGHFVSCLVYLPRDRYTTDVRLRVQEVLLTELGGAGLDYTARVSEAPWAALHLTVRMPAGTRPGDIDVSDARRARIAELLTEATRTWGDRLIGAAGDGTTGDTAAGAAVSAAVRREVDHYAAAFDPEYQQVVDPLDALADIAVVESLTEDSVRLVLTFDADADADGTTAGARDAALLTWYLGGRTASLSRLLPMLQSMGVVVHDERPFGVTRRDGLRVSIYQFRLTPHPTVGALGDDVDRDDLARRFSDTVAAIWSGEAEVDRLNELVLRAGLTWQQVLVLRAYTKYLRQAAFPYSPSHVEAVLAAHPGTARALVAWFEALFDPDPLPGRDAGDAAAAVAADIDALVSLDTDRVLRALASLVEATLRTNFYVTADGSARRRGVVSLKLDPGRIDELPRPRPRFEIFVSSPRVEGVHLRFGPVARGGLRWSDRREDFRTEVLGLVKAQAVKNAVIVPVGAKGGFVVKAPPLPTGDAAADRDGLRAEGVACYRMFIAGLLEITDNVDRETEAVLPPPRVVRRDGDDAYLVVAADKGTATFSDIANEVAAHYGFWLGDAFASGGSVGYDHKAMGITARGAWESVRRHFAELDVDVATDEITVAGVGDMSGDVFGNAMLLSEHLRLVAAFDHRHIFCDPDPDAATSFAERRRLFDLPRSSWADYDRALISAGGGVFRRDQKSIRISPEIRRSLGLPDDVAELTPPQLVRAVIAAPVDLLFNGGIGTYVKAASQPDSEVGDRANDAVRITGGQVRAKVVGEGGNLGVTSAGRVEYDLAGGRINTDAIDNSAGVDCSDHEVNIKILVDALVTAGEVDAHERTALLESMTDEVAALVLDDNVRQNDMLGSSRANAASMITVHARLIERLEAERGLDRELEVLPSAKELLRRADAGIGLTSPELSTLMAHVKLELKDRVLATELPEQDVLAARLPGYFPARLRERFPAAVRRHQLRREITTTVLVNDLVDVCGITYAHRLGEDAGAGPLDAVRTFAATDAIFGTSALLRRIAAADVPVRVRDRMTLDVRRLLDRAARWLLNHRPQPLAIGAEIARFAAAVADLGPRVPQWLRGDDRAIVERAAGELVAHGVDEGLAVDVAGGLYRFSLLDVVDIADIADRDGAEVGELYFALMEHLGADGLLTAVSELPRDDRWRAQARLALRDDLYGSLRSLTFDVLALGEPHESGEEKIAEWESTNGSRVARARRTLAEIVETTGSDLATLSVAARQIRSMTRIGAGSAP